MNDGIDGVYESLLVYKNTKTGKAREYSGTSVKYKESKIWEDKDWTYDTMVQKVIIPTKIPSITDQFNPFIGIDDVEEYEMKLDSVAIKMEDSSITEISIRDYIINPIFINDETELKAISRSNPTVLVIEKAVVTGKYSFRSTPTKEKFITKHLN